MSCGCQCGSQLPTHHSLLAASTAGAPLQREFSVHKQFLKIPHSAAEPEPLAPSLLCSAKKNKLQQPACAEAVILNRPLAGREAP